MNINLDFQNAEKGLPSPALPIQAPILLPLPNARHGCRGCRRGRRWNIIYHLCKMSYLVLIFLTKLVRFSMNHIGKLLTGMEAIASPFAKDANKTGSDSDVSIILR